MSDNWRLVNGKELYEIKKDPGQTNDVAIEFPEKVAEMRAFYEAWWADIEPSFVQTTEMYVGAAEVPEVDLNAHDWISPSGIYPPWNQGAIRLAKGKRTFDGYWAVKVLEAGTYEFKVSRWPLEANHPIVAALPAGENVPGASTAYRANPGAALAFKEAHLVIDGKTIATKPVSKEDVAITFTAELTEGSHQLAPYFSLKAGGEIGAYYLLVTKK